MGPRANFRSLRRNRRLSLLSMAVSLVLVQGGVRRALGATTDTWTDGTGNWSVAANWTNASNGHTAPATADTVNIVNTDGVARTITLDVNSAFIASLTVDLTGAGTATDTLSMNGTNLTINGNETIGNTGRADVTQIGGTHTVGGNLFLGAAAGSSNIDFTLGGNLSASNIYVGGNASAMGGSARMDLFFGGSATTTTLKIYGGGFFVMEGGNLTVGSIDTSGSPSVFFFSSGNLTITGAAGLAVDSTGPLGNSFTIGPGSGVSVTHGNFIVGSTGAASTTQFGTMTVGSVATNENFELGTAPAATGNYTLLQDGVLTVFGEENIGAGGAGNFAQSGGTNNANGQLLMSANGASTYTLTNGALNITGSGNNQALIIGAFTSTATFKQTGGVTSISNGTVDIGYFGTGIVNLSGGSFSITNRTEYIGEDSTGIFTQTGGTHTVGTPSTPVTLNIGYAGAGTYSLSSASSVLTVNGNVNLAAQFPGSVGVWNISGGNATVTGAVTIFNSPGTVLNLSSGTLSVGSLSLDGYYSNFNWTGGTFAITGAAGLTLVGAGPFGNMLSLDASRSLVVSNTLTIQNGPLTLSGGTLTVGALNTLNTPSQFHWTGGTVAITNSNLSIDSLDANAPLGANVTLANGQGLQVLGNNNIEFVGEAGTGSLVQTGGTNAVTTLVLGFQAGGVGNYTLSNASGPATLQVNSDEFVGYLSQGTFTQTGGNHTVGFELGVGASAGGNGTYNMSGGNLTAAGALVIGGGTGIFNQSGGNVTTASISSFRMVVGGVNAPGAGTYNMTSGNGTPTLISNAGEYVGFNGNGTFNQSAGTHTIHNGLYIGAGPATGTYNLFGGVLNVDNIVVGGDPNAPQGTGILNLSPGGTLTASTSVTLYNTTGSEILFSGGSVSTPSLDISANPSGLVWNGGTLTQSPGGTFNVVTLLVPVNGAYVFNGGSFTGQLVNTGTVSFNAAFSASNGMNNGGVVTAVPASAAVSFLGTGLINSGLFSMAGASLSGAINNFGLISGYGTINAVTLANPGTITQSGGPLSITSSSPGTNTGAINGAAGLELQNNSGFTGNDGTISLNGGFLTNTASFTNNIAGMITGPGKISGPFQNAGTLIAAGGVLNITSAWTNTGTVNLSGVGAALSGGTVTNNGVLQGTGTISANVANGNGSVEALGGTLALSGSLSNPVGASLFASTGNKLLVSAGLATNAGLISLTGGTFDNNNHPLNNTGQISGFGTIRIGGLTNNNILTLTDGPSTINGDVFNAAGKTLLAKNFPALFTGNVTNNGTIKTTNTTVTIAGNYTGNAFISDPSTNIFQGSATTIPGGLMTGSTGDAFFFTGGVFTNNGTFANGGNLSVATGIVNAGTFMQSGPQLWLPGAAFTNTAGAATFLSNAKLYGITITSGTVDITAAKMIDEVTPAGKSDALNALHAAIVIHALTASGMPARFGLALLDNAVLNKTIFGGQSVDSNSLLLSQELLGDANADGQVDRSDLNTVLNNFGTSQFAWSSGNFDGASTIDLTDLADVLNNFGITNPNANGATSLAGEPQLPAAVPEGGTIGLLASPLVLVRRRRLPHVCNYGSKGHHASH